MLEFIDGTLHIGNVSATDIANRYGTPVYVYDAGVIRRQIERVTRAFAALPFRPFYAMKANGALAILELVRGAGFGCDAVSPGEIYIARKAGFTPDNIWFTCSNVSDDDLRAIGDERIVINVNSMSEIDRILALDLRNPIALRVNTDIGAGHHVDVVTAGGGVKFGIDLAEIESARMVVEDSGRKVVGLHAHIGSGIDNIAPLIESARRLLDLSTEFPNLRWLNFGGGISVPYEPGRAGVPDRRLRRRADAHRRSAACARDLTAILEPGRYLVAESGTLSSRRSPRNGSAAASGGSASTQASTISCGHRSTAPTITSSTPRPDRRPRCRQTFDLAMMTDDGVIAGNLCESGDVFTRTERGDVVTRMIDRTVVGDLLAFCDAGAYGFSMASLYNARLLPARGHGRRRGRAADPREADVRRPRERNAMIKGRRQKAESRSGFPEDFFVLPFITELATRLLLPSAFCLLPSSPVLRDAAKTRHARSENRQRPDHRRHRRPWYRGDVGVRGDTIVSIGDLSHVAATTTIDAHDNVVSPGFIDLLGQSQFSVFRTRTSRPKCGRASPPR